jgi:transcriptional regulator with XRE-family HTH domain
MPKPSLAADHLPASAAKALRDLGENLALARQRRKESLRAWASRMAVSVPTLIRMEKGDPSVGMGVYATALWLMGRHVALPEVAAPALDLNALEQDIDAVRQLARRLSRKSEEIA